MVRATSPVKAIQETQIQIAGISVNVSLVDVQDDTGGHLELVTIIRSTVEGEPQQYSTCLPFSDYEPWEDIQAKYTKHVARFTRMATN